MSSTEVEGGVSASSGTAAGLLAFLDYLIKRNEMVEATASALRTGVKKVLDVESDLNEVDVRSADLDEIVRRFRNKYRGQIKDKSIDTYEQRFRQSAEMYRKWLNDEDWRPTSVRRRSAAAAATNGASGKTAPAKAARDATVPAPDAGSGGKGPDETSTGMITYPFPIRSGMQGKITLPEDLTRREADRIGRFIATLALDDEEPMMVPPERLAITSG